MDQFDFVVGVLLSSLIIAVVVFVAGLVNPLLGGIITIGWIALVAFLRLTCVKDNE